MGCFLSYLVDLDLYRPRNITRLALGAQKTAYCHPDDFFIMAGHGPENNKPGRLESDWYLTGP